MSESAWAKMMRESVEDIDIDKIIKENKEILRKAGNSRKGNPHPKIHLNMNIKNERKTGPKTKEGKMISSMNAVKFNYWGRASRIREDSLFMKSFKDFLEADGDPILQDMRHVQMIMYLNEEIEKEFTTKKKLPNKIR